MVFFTCGACGESLKKAQIQKHVSSCRRCTVLSCIDCGKDFWGDEYNGHVKCISEDQKYGGKGYEAKANKGDVKQQQWIQRIQDAINEPETDPKLKDVLCQITSFDNVPRKKAKFQNWIMNSLKIYNQSVQDQVWEIFSAAGSSVNGAQQSASATASETNGSSTHPTHLPEQQQDEEEEKPTERKKNKRERKEERQKKKKDKKAVKNSGKEEEQKGEGVSDERAKKKKRKRATEECENEGDGTEERIMKKPKKKNEEETEESQSVEDGKEEHENQEENTAKGTTKITHPMGDKSPISSSKAGKFNWKGTIKAILRQAPGDGLAIKKLRKKVLSAYYSFSGDENYKTEEELYSLFNKKINNPKFKILKEKVRFVK